jgi:hypothetical protein
MLFKLNNSEFYNYKAKTGLIIISYINRIKRLSIGINDWILTKDLSINK